MAKEFDVTIYAVVRVKIKGVTDEDHASAISAAEDILQENYRHQFTRDDSHMSSEYAEDNFGFLVDEVGDEEHEKSKWYCRDGVTEAGNRCLACGIDSKTPPRP